MKKAIASTVTAIAALLVLVLTSLAFAKPPATQASTPLVAAPFKGTLQGLENNVFDYPNLRFFGTPDGSVTAAQPGEYTLDYGIEIKSDTSAGINGAQRFTAANGDSIYAEGRGQRALSETPGVTTITESYAITGGTGRFAGASGSYVVHRMVELATAVTWGSFYGTIAIPQGNQAWPLFGTPRTSGSAPLLSCSLDVQKASRVPTSSA